MSDLNKENSLPFYPKRIKILTTYRYLLLYTHVKLASTKGKNSLRMFKNKVLRKLFGYDRKYHQFYVFLILRGDNSKEKKPFRRGSTLRRINKTGNVRIT
jgi:hypothetical protein